MRASILVFAIVLLIGAVVAQEKFTATWQHTEVSRIIDLTSHVEKVSLVITAKNTGSSAASSYLLAVEPSVARHLAFCQAYKKDRAQLPTREVKVTDSSAPAGTTWWKVDLDKPVAAGESVKIDVLQAFTRRLTPYPESVSQDEAQLVRYSGNAYFFSAYKTAKETTHVKLSTQKPESYSKGSAKLEGDELVSGPHADTAPFSTGELSAHFENNSPFVTFSNHVREIEVSHWGNIAVEDHYNLVNTGAKLKGSFSRYDYQRTGGRTGGSFRSIIAILPASASDVYYRDQIGNISTSRLREADDTGRHFELEPRFPMFGGWKTDFYMGYNVPASEFLGTDDNGRYVLNITFASPFEAAAIDQLEVRITLPEFASDVQWSTPFDIDSAAFDTKMTYLDVFGRTVLILRKANCVRFHNVPFIVTYRFSKIYMLQEPLLLAGGVFLFFLAAMAYARIELSISPKTTQTSLRSRRAGRAGEIINRILTIQPKVVAAYQSRNERNIKDAEPAFNEIKAGIDELSKVGDAQLSRLLQRLEDAHAMLRAAGKKLAKAEEKTLEDAKGTFSDRASAVDGILRELAVL